MQSDLVSGKSDQTSGAKDANETANRDFINNFNPSGDAVDKLLFEKITA
jgi:hypothetical protein